MATPCPPLRVNVREAPIRVSIAGMARRFPLAPMTTDLRVLTAVMLALPLLFLALALWSPPPASRVLGGVFAFLFLLYAVVWLGYRPTAFEVDAATLAVVWPVRRRAIALSQVVGARMVTRGELRQAYGLGMRIGVGGLWGGFGLLRFPAVTFSMWISRTDRFVVVELREGRPLLTPADPERFLEALPRRRE